VPFQIMGDFDFNGMSNGVSAGAYSGVGVFNRGRQSRSLQYMTPNMGGLSAQFGFVPKGNGEEGDKSVFSAGVKYSAGPLAAAVSMESKRDSASDNFSSVAASYDFGVAKVMAGYANGGKLAAGCALFSGCNQNSGKGYTLGVTAPIAGWTAGLIYANNSDNNAKIKATEFFVNKEIFKNTYGYFEAGSWKGIVDAVEGTKKSGSGYALGVIFVF
jgi:predicted porin